MINHPNRRGANASLPFLTRADVSAIKFAVGYAGAGPIDGWTFRTHELLEGVGEKIAAAPPGAVWLPLSMLQLSVLWHALRNGAGDDAINELGLKPKEKEALVEACNSIKLAGKIEGPSF